MKGRIIRSQNHSCTPTPLPRQCVRGNGGNGGDDDNGDAGGGDDDDGDAGGDGYDDGNEAFALDGSVSMDRGSRLYGLVATWPLAYLASRTKATWAQGWAHGRGDGMGGMGWG